MLCSTLQMCFCSVFSCTCFLGVENPIILNFKKNLGTHEIESSALQVQEPIAEGIYYVYINVCLCMSVNVLNVCIYH